MKYLEKFLKASGQSSGTKNDTAGNNQASVLLVRGKRFFPGSEIDKKDCKQSIDLQYKAQKSANTHNNNTPITELDRRTDNNLQNPNLEKCVTHRPAIPTPDILRKDFVMAKQMFAGHGSRIICNRQAIKYAYR